MFERVLKILVIVLLCIVGYLLAASLMRGMSLS